LIRIDQSVMRGEAGVLDMDPICRCQDFDLKTTAVEVTMSGSRQSRAKVSFENLGERHDVNFNLVWGEGRLAYRRYPGRY
jgi:hypothetical protein